MSTALRLEDVYITPEEYLAGERISQTRHEYFAGAIRGMAGATANHARVVQNLAFHLGGQLRGGPCEVFTQDIKVNIRTVSEEFYYYPDVVVDCSRAPGRSLFAPEPKVIFEVSSLETEQVDRGEKRASYCTLPSLQVYVLVRQSDAALLIYRRAGAEWNLEFLSELDSTLSLPEIGCALPLRAIYERVVFGF